MGKQTKGEPIAQMYFEFKDFDAMVESWDNSFPIYGEEMQLVISRHPYSSGYWIEEAGKECPDRLDTPYIGEKALPVINKIKQEIADSKKEGRTAKFIYF